MDNNTYHTAANRTLDIKSKLQEYLPSVINLLNDDVIGWANINKLFEADFQKRMKRYSDNNDALRVECSFYDIISASLGGNPYAIKQLDFFDKVFKNLDKNIPIQKKVELKSLVYSLLTNFDRIYLNQIGELAILNSFLSSNNYSLEVIEFPLGNGNRIDFKLFNQNKNDSVLIEILNIHLTKPLSDNYSEIKKFLTKRLEDKIKAKTKAQLNECNFSLASVIWSEKGEYLKRISAFYKAGFTIDVPNALEPFAYICDTNDKVIQHKFGHISSLFNN